jgi:hypothetical protein
VGGVIAADDVGGDAAPVGDFEAFGACPFADCGLIMAADWRGGPAGSPGGGYAASGGDVGLQCLGELVGVLLREIDLVAGAVESELNGPFGGAAMQVIGEDDLCALCHVASSPLSRLRIASLPRWKYLCAHDALGRVNAGRYPDWEGLQ